METTDVVSTWDDFFLEQPVKHSEQVYEEWEPAKKTSYQSRESDPLLPPEIRIHIWRMVLEEPVICDMASPIASRHNMANTLAEVSREAMGEVLRTHALRISRERYGLPLREGVVAASRRPVVEYLSITNDIFRKHDVLSFLPTQTIGWPLPGMPSDAFPFERVLSHASYVGSVVDYDSFELDLEAVINWPVVCQRLDLSRTPRLREYFFTFSELAPKWYLGGLEGLLPGKDTGIAWPANNTTTWGKDQPNMGSMGYGLGNTWCGGHWPGFRYFVDRKENKVEFSPVALSDIAPVFQAEMDAEHPFLPEMMGVVYIVRRGEKAPEEAHHNWLVVQEYDADEKHYMSQIRSLWQYVVASLN